MLQFNFQPFPVIETERLVLRQVTVDDAPDVLILRSDKSVLTYLDRAPLVSIDEAIALVQKIQEALDKNEGITWAISLKESPKIIGTIGFWKTDPQNHRAEIGYMLSPQYQRRGFTQEAITAVIDYGFNRMQLHSIEANINPANEASMKLLEKNNFVREAYFRENYYFDGQFLDSVIYSLLKPVQL